MDKINFNQDNGFTLIEIMLVAIIAPIIVMAITTFYTRYDKIANQGDLDIKRIEGVNRLLSYINIDIKGSQEIIQDSESEEEGCPFLVLKKDDNQIRYNFFKDQGIIFREEYGEDNKKIGEIAILSNIKQIEVQWFNNHRFFSLVVKMKGEGKASSNSSFPLLFNINEYTTPS
ncbi:MAG: type II secretion system protein [bacterium]